MDRHPEVTIGIPFFNASATLAASVRSVFTQTFTNWELILVDDGSTDGSLEALGDVRDSRVRVIADGRNRKLPARLNQLIQLARGPYLARMDADDIMHYARIERQFEYLKANCCVDVLGTGAYVIDEVNRILGKRVPTARPGDVNAILRTGAFLHPTVMGRTEWFLAHPYCEEPWCERSQDLELWSRTCDTSVFHNLSEPLLYYRDRGPFDLGAYIRSKRAKEMVIRRLGTRALSRRERRSLIRRERMKWVVFVLGKLLGVADTLRARRNQGLTTAEQTSARKMLLRSLDFSLTVIRSDE